MDAGLSFLLDIFVVFCAAQIGAEIAQRLKMPAVVGEIAAGLAISPFGLDLIHISGGHVGPALAAQAEIGAILLLFSVGLETSIADLRKVGVMALVVATLGVILPFALGGTWAHLQGFPWTKSMFIGVAFVATSVGITARVLQELGVLSALESRIILGAAVIDDVLGMLLLGVVTSLETAGTFNLAGLGLVLFQALAFLVIITFVGTSFMRRRSEMLDAPINPHSPLTLALTLCLALAAASVYIGLAAIIGAFLAGMIIAESRQRELLEVQLRPLTAFLTPFFFVITGASVDLSQLTSGAALLSVAVVTLLAVFSKIVGCGLGALPLGLRSAVTIGVGMCPRGEVGIIIASLGLKAGVFTNQVYGIVIAMSLLTSILTPPLLKRLYARPAA